MIWPRTTVVGSGVRALALIPRPTSGFSIPIPKARRSIGCPAGRPLIHADLRTFRPTPGESTFERSCQNSLKSEVKVGRYTYISMSKGR